MTRNEYNECPNLCKACGKPIFCTPNQNIVGENAMKIFAN